MDLITCDCVGHIKFVLASVMRYANVPPSSLLNSKESNYVNKSKNSWNLVMLPASSTKGGERGVLKAPGLD
jgi:hypothetical protein